MNDKALVERVFLADDPSTFVTKAVASVRIEIGGIPGDRHFGVLRPADARQHVYPRGTLIANRRQVSLVSVEECAEIAKRLGIAEVKPEWLGANVMISGIDRVTLLPRGTRLLFSSGAGLICEGENLPCVGPGKMIEAALRIDGLHKEFVRAAQRARGIVCSVEREGWICQEDVLDVKRI